MISDSPASADQPTAFVRSGVIGVVFTIENDHCDCPFLLSLAR
jgi:hypothetical protein